MWWRFKAHNNDFYVGAHGMGQFKLSFHPQGFTAWAFTKSFFKQARSLIKGPRRQTEQWLRPSLTQENPVVIAYRIAIPGEDPALDQVAVPPPDLNSPNCRLEAAPFGAVRYILVVFSLLGPESVSPDTELLRVFSLGTGEHVFLVTGTAPFSWQSIKLPAQPATDPDILEPGSPAPNCMRATLHVTDDSDPQAHSVLDVPVYRSDALHGISPSQVNLIEVPVTIPPGT